ncbi:MAG: VOC family protein [Myxococcota bacterium]
MSAPRLGYVILYVESLEKAMRFYCEGLGFSEKARHGDYGELATGDTILGLAERNFVAGHFTGELPPPGQGASEIAVVFDREDVRPAYERALAAGAKAVVEPREESWKQLVSYVRDPDGHLLEICSPVG